MKNLLPSYEVWNWIKKYEGRYEISNRGKLRSWFTSCGNILKTKEKVSHIKFLSTPKNIKVHTNKWGYHQSGIGGNRFNDHKKIRIHREVAKIFNPNQFNKPEVNHINGDKGCNEWHNLEWNTRLENIDHAFRTGLIIPAVGEQQSNTKLKNEQVLEIFNSQLPSKELSRKFGVGNDTISSIKIGRTWNHITGKKRNPKVEKLTKEFIMSIFKYDGSINDSALFFGKSYSLCRKIKDGVLYSDITGKKFERVNKIAIKPTEDIINFVINSKLSTKEIALSINSSESFVKKIKHDSRN